MRPCQQCGVELTEDSLQGLCPGCLLRPGLLSETVVSTASDEDATVVDAEGPGSIVPPVPREGERFGDYQLIRVLGQGGMGTVFEADHLPSERRVALKVLNHELDSSKARERFLHEGQLAASINHPNSVYVFGTEEIDGMPVISMELLPAGTLKDRVKERGPMPATEAVDAILQVIAGLEAAQAKGILHRDIKPANCFVDADGTVKVGDFGLSISTMGRTEANMTMSGAITGTPAFASPEQLRGNELDLRSDIYSTGLTLYYLLTTKVPFEETNLARLVTMVVERPPESPAKLRRGIPKELARAILRCLAKKKEDRFRDYEELRGALLPFSSTTVPPAPLGLRFVAGCLDIALFYVAVSVPIGIWTATFFPQQDLVGKLNILFWSWFLTFGIAVVYFTIMESVWGASVGKLLCSIRVVRANGEAPSLQSSFLRALIFVFASEFDDWVGMSLGLFSGDWDFARKAVKILSPALIVLLFVTVDRRNSAIHDKLTKTFVISKPRGKSRLKAPTHQALGVVPGATPRIGPYHVIDTFLRIGSVKLLPGWDERLLRHVWIREVPLGTPHLDERIRGQNRPGRLRWLNGKRADDEAWDAFEALSGKSFPNLLQELQPWDVVRRQLLALAEELDAARKDHSLSDVLDLEQVWVTDDGRVVLLDFVGSPRQSTGDGVEPQSDEAEFVFNTEAAPGSPDSAAPAALLRQAAASVLKSRMDACKKASPRSSVLLLPMSARYSLERLCGGGNTVERLPDASSEYPETIFGRMWRLFLDGLSVRPTEGFEEIVQEIRRLENGPVLVSRGRRLVLLLGCVGITLSSAYKDFGGRRLDIPLENEFSELAPLCRCLERLEAIREVEPPGGTHLAQELKALETYIAGRFQKVFAPTGWEVPVWATSSTRTYKVIWVPVGGGELSSLSISPLWDSLAARCHVSGSRRELAQQLLARRPQPSEIELEQATARLKLLIAGIEPTPGSAWIAKASAFQALLEWRVFNLATVCLAFALLFRGGLLIHLLGIAVVNRDSSRASRLRVFWRSLITWSPILLIHFLIPYFDGSWAMWSVIGLLLVVFVGGVVRSIINPQRGLQDQLAGTWLVPR